MFARSRKLQIHLKTNSQGPRVTPPKQIVTPRHRRVTLSRALVRLYALVALSKTRVTSRQTEDRPQSIDVTTRTDMRDGSVRSKPESGKHIILGLLIAVRVVLKALRDPSLEHSRILAFASGEWKLWAQSAQMRKKDMGRDCKSLP